jgi:conjugal transfer pilus assembly protein TraL
MQAKIPRYIDDLPQILWWEIDEVSLFAGLFGLGIILGATGIGFIGGILCSYVLQKLKSRRGSEFVMHWGYWNGIIPIKPPSWKEEFYE